MGKHKRGSRKRKQERKKEKLQREMNGKPWEGWSPESLPQETSRQQGRKPAATASTIVEKVYERGQERRGSIGVKEI